MYNYRAELKRHFFAIVIPNGISFPQTLLPLKFTFHLWNPVTISLGSLFLYPLLCHTIGISAPRSLSFAARSLTLALATPATKNLGGDLNTVAALAIMSGILGVLIGGRLLKTLKIPEGMMNFLLSLIARK
jgi:hypothetical protein